MAKPRAPRLKVFQAQMGFFDSVVAAPSQAAALRAWETRQDLFASGDARLATDEAAVNAALAHPGTPLQRPVGTKDAFSIQATGLPKGAPDVGSPDKRKPKLKPDRSKLDAAEAALGRLEQKRELQEAELEREQQELEERRTAAREAYAAARKSAEAKVAAARAAYRASGGE